jgi:hypothetical protein
MSITEEVDKMVQHALQEGEKTLIETDTYRQHLLREHPNVCRQAFAHTDVYRLHEDPCNCPPSEQGEVKRKVLEVTCCWLVQPIGSPCVLCGDEVAS